MGARIYADSRTADGGPAAIAFFENNGDEFTVSLKGAAEGAHSKSLLQTNEIYGLEMFASVAAVAA